MSDRKLLRRADLVHDFSRLGVPRGGLLMVHSSLRSMGYVDGGAETVVAALVESLGPRGTLVAPTFTFPVAKDPHFVFDPQHTPSYMGAISEAARRHPDARRSIHLFHSVAAIGPLAETIATSGGPSAWDSQSPMAKLMDMNGAFLMLGVPYRYLTAVHVLEIELEVPYRPPRTVQGRMRQPDGSIVPLTSRVHSPGPEHTGNDFNRLGQRMEDAGVVKVGEVGNALARVFYGHDMRTMGRALYERDQNAFVIQNRALTRLSYGHTVDTPRGHLCVVDPRGVYQGL